MAPIDKIRIGRESDSSRILAALRRERTAEVPFFELMADPLFIWRALGKSWPEEEKSAKGLRERYRLESEFYSRLGYDFITVRIDTGFPRARREVTGAEGGRQWIQASASFIGDREAFKRFDWPRAERVDLTPLEIAAEVAPPAMTLIPRTSGVFENTSWLAGVENLSYLLADDPELARDIFERVGEHISAVHRRMVRGPRVGATLMGDDLGFRSATLISPADLRKYVFPHHAACARAAHEAGAPFLLHSCGNLREIMEDLAGTAQIDAKHSYEDAIEPVEEVYEKWKGRVAVLGGVDMDLLSRGTPQEVRRRTRRILEKCAPEGGYALGSGNSLSDYVRWENYAAMLEEGARWKS